MDLSTFQSLPTDEVAQIVRERGPGVVVFPINGTRRWFMLEHQADEEETPVQEFLDRLAQRHCELYGMWFEHGVHTIVSPIFGPDILERRDGHVSAKGMELLAAPTFRVFYEQCGIRVRFYGEYELALKDTPYAGVTQVFERITADTALNDQHRLFFGVCGNDATEATARIGARFQQMHGHSPDRTQIVQAYYGEYIEPVDIFVGFGAPAAFDMPLIATGSEDLYFTVAPSPYLDKHALRTILHDHLFVRQVEPSYDTVTARDRDILKHFYDLNRHTVMGIGLRLARGGVWLPRGEIREPVDFADLFAH